MYRLLIVDDEEIEREGMARLIPWEDFDIELAGTAWNGAEGFEKIQSCRPDIVLTDIKMPVMDGIELIRRTRKEFPEVEFVVLSGYGEFQFTSQAMAEGVRHYLLKPCDEEQICGVLEKVKEEIDQKRARARKEQEYETAVYRLLPKAREQVFRNMLLDREYDRRDYELFMKEYEGREEKSVLLAFWKEKGFDYLERFVLQNVLTELLGEAGVYLSAYIGEMVVFLAAASVMPKISGAVDRTLLEFKRLAAAPVLAALSGLGELGEASVLYGQVQELIWVGQAEGQKGLLSYSWFRERSSQAFGLVDYKRIREAEDYGELLFELYFTFMKMDLEQYSLHQKRDAASWILKVLYGISLEAGEGQECSWQLLEQTVGQIAEKKGLEAGKGKEGERMKAILLAFFRYIQDPDMSIQFLAREILFMNEDYFGRLFLKNRHTKFSAYLLDKRISLAKRLMEYRPELKISQIAELTGYAPDGQYFSKAFRRVTGVTPLEYKTRRSDSMGAD